MTRYDSERGETGNGQSARPNVVYVTVDSIRADHVGFLGYDRPTTPVLDELAAEGTVFERAYAAGIPTYYSFKSLLGGVPSLGLTADVGMPASATTLAEAFSAAGYRTAGFNAGNPWLTRDYGYGRGFDEFRDYLTDDTAAGKRGSRFWAMAKRFREVTSRSPVVEDKLGLAARMTFAATDRTPLEDAETVTDAAVDWMAAGQDDDSPFFLWVHYMDPHYPWVPREVDIEPFREGGVSRWQVGRLWHTVSVLNHAANGTDVSASDLELVRDLYDAEVRRTDAAIGRLLNAVTAAGIDDNTIVAVAGDHGTELHDHGGFSHGPYALHEEVIRVPLLFAGPGVPQGRQERAVSLLDVPVTLLSAAGLETPEPMRAFGSTSLFDGPSSPAVTEVVFGFEPVTESNAGNGRLASVVEWPWKLVVDDEHGTQSLYQLDDDPEERTDRSENEPPIVESLGDVLATHRRRVSAVEPSDAATEREDSGVDPSDVERRLESLGYL
jgi:arylsulfatase A-like enzyme